MGNHELSMRDNENGYEVPIFIIPHTQFTVSHTRWVDKYVTGALLLFGFVFHMVFVVMTNFSGYWFG